jgi:hypothetical protein
MVQNAGPAGTEYAFLLPVQLIHEAEKTQNFELEIVTSLVNRAWDVEKALFLLPRAGGASLSQMFFYSPLRSTRWHLAIRAVVQRFGQCAPPRVNPARARKRCRNAPSACAKARMPFGTNRVWDPTLELFTMQSPGLAGWKNWQSCAGVPSRRTGMYFPVGN